MDDIHFNPVRHGLVACAAAWPFSSVARCVRLGMYPSDWASHESELAEAGERR